jgi:hypothetical protein
MNFATRPPRASSLPDEGTSADPRWQLCDKWYTNSRAPLRADFDFRYLTTAFRCFDVDLWDSGANKNATWHCACVIAWQFWNAPSGEAALLRRLQARRGESVGCRAQKVLRDREVAVFSWCRTRGVPIAFVLAGDTSGRNWSACRLSPQFPPLISLVKWRYTGSRIVSLYTQSLRERSRISRVTA